VEPNVKKLRLVVEKLEEEYDEGFVEPNPR